MPFGMRRFEGHRYLYRHTECFIELQWTTPQAMTQRFTVDVFSGDVVGVSGFADLENGENVWMIQCQNRARFLFEAAQAAFRSREFLRQDLQRDLAGVLFCVLAKKDFAHAALAQPA